MEFEDLMSEYSHRAQLLKSYRRRRQILEIQKSSAGIFVPTNIVMEIEGIDKNIKQITKEMDMFRSQMIFLSNLRLDDVTLQFISDVVISSIEAMRGFAHLETHLQTENQNLSAVEKFSRWSSVLRNSHGYGIERYRRQDDSYTMERKTIFEDNLYEVSMRLDISEELGMYILVMTMPRKYYEDMTYLELIKIAAEVNGFATLGSMSVVEERTLQFRYSLFAKGTTFDQIVAVLLYFEEMFIVLHDYCVHRIWKRKPGGFLPGS